MELVIELKTKKLVKFAHYIFDKFFEEGNELVEMSPGTYYAHPYYHISDDDYKTLNDEIPWLDNKVMLGRLQPGCACPVHIDNHDGDHKYNLNVRLDDGGENRYTKWFYHPEKDPWDPNEHGWVVPKEQLRELENLGVYRIKTDSPIIFNKDYLHGVFNENNEESRIVMFITKIGVDLKHIQTWLKENSIEYTTVLETDRVPYDH